MCVCLCWGKVFPCCYRQSVDLGETPPLPFFAFLVPCFKKRCRVSCMWFSRDDPGRGAPRPCWPKTRGARRRRRFRCRACTRWACRPGARTGPRGRRRPPPCSRRRAARARAPGPRARPRPPPGSRTTGTPASNPRRARRCWDRPTRSRPRGPGRTSPALCAPRSGIPGPPRARRTPRASGPAGSRFWLERPRPPFRGRSGTQDSSSGSSAGSRPPGRR
mmetsp:Transcript_20839/g.46983  ORF Transcript_20839/g.46983 Transcript_20839/m.46983 type:complete len:219 (+) Transcript_20839:564-1220(+)